MEATEATKELIGPRLRRLRTERRLSQRELSSPGVSYAYISRIEGGTRQPSVKALRMLARRLGVSAEYLETGNELGAAEQRELRVADAELGVQIGDRPREIIPVLEEVLADAEAAGEGPLAARARVALGITAAREGNDDLATSLLEVAIEKKEVAAVDRPDAIAALGDLYLAGGHQQRAVLLFQDALEEVRQDAPDEVAVRGRLGALLGGALAEAGDVDRAAEVVEEALDGADAMADPYGRIRLYWSLSRLATHECRWAAALAYGRRAVALLRATEDELALARAYLLGAWVVGWRGDHAGSGRYLTLAERLLGHSPDPRDLGRLRVEQAKRAVALEDADEALARAREAMSLTDGTDGPDEASAHWALAEALALTGDVDQAGGDFERAVTMLADHRKLRDAARAARQWGRMLREAGREDEALDVMERATDIAVRGDVPAGVR